MFFFFYIFFPSFEAICEHREKFQPRVKNKEQKSVIFFTSCKNANDFHNFFAAKHQKKIPILCT